MKQHDFTFRNNRQKKRRQRVFLLLSPVLALACLVCAIYLTGVANGIREQEELIDEMESQGMVIQAGVPRKEELLDPIETERSEEPAVIQESQLQVIPADDATMIYITPRMTYTFEFYDARTGEKSCQEKPIPNEMYGLNRVELEQYLIELSAKENETLTDIKHHYELQEFSRRAFTVRKTITEVYAVFLIAEEGYVVAYSGDRTQLYELTHIPLEDFPLEQQTMLTYGIYMKTMTDYYDFLETYSS